MIAKFWCGRRGWLVLLLSLLPVCNAWAVTWTYYVYTGCQRILDLPEDSSFTAYKGETVTFNTWNRDRDKRVDDSCPPVTQYYWASSSVYENHWTISGKASFSSSSSVKSKDISGLNSGNVYVYVDSTFANGDSITVTVVLDDDSTNGPPGTDNDGDSARSHSWTITFKTRCPTSLACISPSPDCTAEQPNPASYTYRLDPDIPPAGRPDYAGVTIHESFGAQTSNIDKDVHVTAAGRAAHPTWTNAQWRDYFFGTTAGLNSTGTPDGNDQIMDTHGGMFITTVYLVSPPTADLYVDLPQTYTCHSDNGNLNQSYTIRRICKATTGALRIKKS